jgi:RNA polymerase sigma factor (TIGR02999 family)
VAGFGIIAPLTGFPKFPRADERCPVSELSQSDVTRMLQEWSDGDRDVPARLMPVVYAELRRLAARYMRRERADHTLQPTALVNEAYLRLSEQSHLAFSDRAHFFGVAAKLMRRILVDYARRHNAEKRGVFRDRVLLDEAVGGALVADLDLIALDDALQHLAKQDQRQARVVELRFFGGLSVDETAETLGVSTATVKNDWRMAKAWLRREISRTESDADSQ